MNPSSTQTDANPTDRQPEPAGVEAEKAQSEIKVGPFVAALRPELRAIFEASWAQNEAAYRLLAR